MSTFIDNYSTLYNISNIDKNKRNILPNLFNSTIHASRNIRNRNDIINLIPIKNNNKSIKLNVLNNNTYQKKFKSYETIDNGNDEIMFKLRLNRGKKKIRQILKIKMKKRINLKLNQLHLLKKKLIY